MIEKTSRLVRISFTLLFQLIDQKILPFGMVGAIGFIVDALLLTMLTIKLGLDVLPSRAVSFTCATLVTWLLNRTFTFSRQAGSESHTRKKEYIFYLIVQMVGAALNFLVFLALIEWQPVLKQMPVIPLAGGALVALVFNFTMSCKFVFKNRVGCDE